MRHRVRVPVPFQRRGPARDRRDASTSHAPKTTAYVGCFASAKPRVVIPVFPGNNCEYDTAARLRARRRRCRRSLVVNNLTPAAVAESTQALVDAAFDESQIVMIPGGFSGGDEPDGSAKFITAFFRAPEVTEAVRDLLQEPRRPDAAASATASRRSSSWAWCPTATSVPMDRRLPDADLQHHRPPPEPTGAHARGLQPLPVAVARLQVGDIHTVAISHGEGRFVASDELLAQLAANGQIATQYVDETGTPGMDLDVNPNGSRAAPSRASPARTAACSARWATPSVPATACTTTCRATSTSRSSRPAWNTSPPDNRRVSRLIRHTGKELSGSFPFLFMPVMG